MITKEVLKDSVVDYIKSRQGAKGTQLAADVCELFFESKLGQTCDRQELKELDLPTILDELVVEGRIIEIEYVLSDPMLSDIKSFYLPAGTKVGMGRKKMDDMTESAREALEMALADLREHDSEYHFNTRPETFVAIAKALG